MGYGSDLQSNQQKHQTIFLITGRLGEARLVSLGSSTPTLDVSPNTRVLQLSAAAKPTAKLLCWQPPPVRDGARCRQLRRGWADVLWAARG